MKTIIADPVHQVTFDVDICSKTVLQLKK